MSGDKKLKGSKKPTKSKSETSPENGKQSVGKTIVLDKAQWRTVETSCEIMCTGEEIAALLGIDYDTLVRCIKDTYDLGFSEYYAQKSVTGKKSLRRVQFDSALHGNAHMMKWLGIQWLNQKDKLEHSGDEGAPIILAYPLPSK